MDKIVNWLLENIQQHGLLAVFTGSILEEMIAPIPSPAVMMGSGVMLLGEHSSVSSGFIIELLTIALIGGIGALLGSYLMYFISYFGGKPVIDRTQKFTGVKWSTIEKFQEKFKGTKRDEITIATLRSIPVMPAVVISLTCGALRINPLSYSISFFLGGIVRNLIFLIIGWRIGESYKSLAHGFDSLQNVVTVLIGGLMFAGLVYLYWRRHKAEKAEEAA
jgi:membrane protein DedA with SNARE-associated domain